MKEVIKQLKEDLREYKECFKEAKKFKEWQDVAQLAVVIEYIEDLIFDLKDEIESTVAEDYLR